jgi:hypothetical protein
MDKQRNSIETSARESGGVGMEATGHSRWFERLLAELVSSCGSESCGDQNQAREEAVRP